MSARNILVIVSAALISVICYHRSVHTRYAGLLADVMGTISAQYVEPVSQRDLFEGAMEGMTRRLDEYSGYIDPESYSQLHESLEQQFGGVGIMVEIDRESNRLTIFSPLVDTPAHRAGLRPGDVILEIDGEDTTDFSLKDSVQRMRGAPETTVRLKVAHEGSEEPEELELRREIIPIQSVYGDTRDENGAWNFVLAYAPRIGYIRVTTFGDHTAQEIRDAIGPLHGRIDGLVLDLRGNAGGLLTAAVEVCDLFVDDGGIVTTQGRSGRVEDSFEARSGNEVVDEKLPMVVLVDHYSASASEILSACLQDHRRAAVVGQRTWGKGTVQNVIEMEGGRSALKLTTATYWRPSGKNIHRLSTASDEDDWGVSPDEGLEVVLESEEFQRMYRERRARDVLDTSSEANDTHDEPTKNEPAGIESTGIEPIGIESTGIEPIGIEPIGIEPTGIEPTGIESTEDGLADGEPIQGVQPADQPADQDPSAGPTEPYSDRPFDPQLEKAVQHIESQMAAPLLEAA